MRKLRIPAQNINVGWVVDPPYGCIAAWLVVCAVLAVRFFRWE